MKLSRLSISHIFSRSIVFIIAALSLVQMVCASPVATHPKAHSLSRFVYDDSKFYPESEIHYGQSGYALTVFRGQKIERFNVKMIGLLKNVNNGKDLIAFRAVSGPSVSRHLNIPHGMSGSPVYIGNRLVGAISYGFPFGREPIGLITPIRDMLDSWDPELPQKPILSDWTARQPLSSVTVDSSQLAQTFGADVSDTVGNQSQVTFEPMMTPLSVSGLSPQVMTRLGADLAPFNLQPVTSGGGASEESKPTHAQLNSAINSFQPGAAVAVSLAQGDVDMSAIGTVTYRDKNRVLIFGHPFMGIGPIDAALKTASITELFPSYQDSTKLGIPGITIGRIFQDRPFSVGGEIGEPSKMIPVTVSINDDSDMRHRTYHSQVIDHPLLTGKLVQAVVDEAISEMHGTPGDAVAYVTTDVQAEQVGHIVRKNVYFDPISVDDASTNDLANIISLLSSNRFYQLGIQSVKMSIRIEDRHATATIDHIVVPRTTYQPGDTVKIGVVLQPFKQDAVVRTVSIKIPQTTPDGVVGLVVRGGGSSSAPQILFDGGGGGGISLRQISLSESTEAQPATIAQMVRQYLEQPKNNEIVVSLALPSSAPEVNGEKFSLLPPTMSAIMRSQHATGLHLLRDEVKQSTPVEWIVDGAQQIQINVQKKTGLEMSPSPDQTPNPASPPSPNPGGSLPGDSGPSQSVAADEGEDVTPVSTGSDSDLSDETVRAALPLPSPSQPVGPKSPAGNHADAPSATVDGGSNSSDWTPMTGPSSIKPSDQGTSIVRAASIWRQSSTDEFEDGQLDHVAITSAPDVRLAVGFKPIATTNSSYVWSQVYDDRGNLYIGTGDNGLIYKIAPGNNKPVIFAQTNELEVTSLAFDAQTGNLYAGTSPHGAVFKIALSGKITPLGVVSDHYVMSIVVGKSHKSLYFATAGGTGRVYLLDLAVKKATPKAIFTSPDSHLLSLAQDSNGILYTGGNPNGVVYAFDPANPAKGSKVVYDSPGSTVSAITVSADNTLYVGTAPNGVVYKVVLPGGGYQPTPQVADTILPHAAGFISGLGLDPSGNVWASSGDTLYRITPTKPYMTASFPSDPPVTFTTIGCSSLGAVSAGTASIAGIYGTDNPVTIGKESTGIYTSPIHDARLKSKWGAITWRANLPKTAELTVQTRSGDVPDPDSTWSDWQDVAVADGGNQVVSPDARFLQYRAILKTTGDPITDSPRLHSVSVYYMTQNRPPSVHIVTPFSGEAISGNVNLRWSAVDPDHDTLQYEVYTSSDDGATWSKLDTSAKSSSHSDNPSSDTPAPKLPPVSTADLTSKISEELKNHPEIPEAVRKKILEQSASGQLDATYAAMTGSAQAPPAPVKPVANGPLRSPSFSWPTKSLPDGEYRYKVVASDAPSNAVGSLTDTAISEPFIVVNTPPAITLDPTGTHNGAVTITGKVKSVIVFVKAVQYKLDGGDWQAAAPTNGIFDTSDEGFEIDLPQLAVGTHHITIQAFDRAGNSSTKELDIP